MMRSRLAHLLDRLVLWLRERLVTPAVNDLLAAFTRDLNIAFAETRRDADAHYRLVRREIADARGEIRLLNDELTARPATAEQMAAFAARLDRVDARLAHLAALMYGKSVAETVIASRGPREFTHEDRQ